MNAPDQIVVEDGIWLLQEGITGKWFFLEVDSADTSVEQYPTSEAALEAWALGQVKLEFDDGGPQEGQMSLGL